MPYRCAPIFLLLFSTGCPGTIEDPSRFGFGPPPVDAGPLADGGLAGDGGREALSLEDDAGASVDAGLGEPPDVLAPLDLEAESMQLTGYVVEDAEPTRVRLPDGALEGSAYATFEGAAGTYRLRARVVHEDDGQPTLRVRVGALTVLEETFALAAEGFAVALTDEATVTLAPGDAIVVEGTADGGAWARFDRLELRP